MVVSRYAMFLLSARNLPLGYKRAERLQLNPKRKSLFSLVELRPGPV